jgi:MtN3 and saliva related transmembrane protein
MNITLLIGLLAAGLTTFSFVPQIVKVLKTKSSRDVSLLMLLQLSSGVVLWIVYGLSRQDIIIITANIITLVSLLFLLFLYALYAKQT